MNSHFVEHKVYATKCDFGVVLHLTSLQRKSLEVDTRRRGRPIWHNFSILQLCLYMASNTTISGVAKKSKGGLTLK